MLPKLELPVCKCCGIPIVVHAFLIMYFVWDLANAEARVPRKGPQHLPDYNKAFSAGAVVLAGFIVLFFTVFIHEIGHCAAAKLCGGSVNRIVLWPLGGIAFCAASGNPLHDVLIALAGPATHAPQWACWWGIHNFLQRHDYPALERISAGAMRLQITLTLFNLLVPCYPLDGSKVIVGSMRFCGASKRASGVIVCLLSFCIIGMMVASMIKGFHLPIIGTFQFGSLNCCLMFFMAYETYRVVKSITGDNITSHPLFQQKDNYCEFADESSKRCCESKFCERTPLNAAGISASRAELGELQTKESTSTASGSKSEPLVPSKSD